MAKPKFFVALFEDGGENAIANFYEIDAGLHDELLKLVEFWQESTPRPPTPPPAVADISHDAKRILIGYAVKLAEVFP